MVRYPVWLAWAAAGCSGPQRHACDALMACASAVNPFLVEDLGAEYGPEGQCFAEHDGDECAARCTDEVIALWLPSGNPACDPEPLTGEAMLSEPGFTRAYWEALCDLNEACIGRDVCAYDEPPEVLCFGGQFDPDDAAACLASPGECVDNGSSRYIEIRDVCSGVCEYD